MRAAPAAAAGGAGEGACSRVQGVCPAALAGAAGGAGGNPMLGFRVHVYAAPAGAAVSG